MYLPVLGGYVDFHIPAGSEYVEFCENLIGVYKYMIYLLKDIYVKSGYL